MRYIRNITQDERLRCGVAGTCLKAPALQINISLYVLLLASCSVNVQVTANQSFNASSG